MTDKGSMTSLASLLPELVGKQKHPIEKVFNGRIYHKAHCNFKGIDLWKNYDSYA